jgi:hypothetical protein
MAGHIASYGVCECCLTQLRPKNNRIHAGKIHVEGNTAPQKQRKSTEHVEGAATGGRGYC